MDSTLESASSSAFEGSQHLINGPNIQWSYFWIIWGVSNIYFEILVNVLLFELLRHAIPRIGCIQNVPYNL